MRRLGFTLVWVLLGSCATASLRPDAAKVQIVTASPAGCSPLGVVIGTSGGYLGGYVSNQTLTESAVNDALNRAADRGATHAILQGTQLGAGNTGATATTIAFRCPAPAEAPAP